VIVIAWLVAMAVSGIQRRKLFGCLKLYYHIIIVYVKGKRMTAQGVYY